MTEIKIDRSGERIDKYLAGVYKDKSRTFLQSAIKREDILVNFKPVKPNYRLQDKDIIKIIDLEEEKIELIEQDLNLKIIYEDEDIAIVDKPVDMIVHPSKNNEKDSLVNGLLYQLDSLSTAGEYFRPGIVHRLDKNTSGIMLVAKTDKAYFSLIEQFKNRTVIRGYMALVEGHIEKKEGRIDAPIGRDPNDRTKMCVINKNSKRAITDYRVLVEYENFSLVAYQLKTGRMHQIRVHSYYMGNPVLGDDKYSNLKSSESYQLLHASRLGFIHPSRGEYMEFESELPERFKKYLKEGGQNARRY